MLSNFSSERGSAVTEFVIVLVPASLLVLPLMGLLTLLQQSVINEQVAFDTARFAALADSETSATESYAYLRDPKSQVQLMQAEGYCVTQVTVTSTYTIPLWPDAVTLEGRANAQCENQ